MAPAAWQIEVFRFAIGVLNARSTQDRLMDFDLGNPSVRRAEATQSTISNSTASPRDESGLTQMWTMLGSTVYSLRMSQRAKVSAPRESVTFCVSPGARATRWKPF